MKKFVIDSEKLKPALRKLALAVNPKTITPALSNILCRVEKDKVELITSDLELTIIYSCSAETEGAPFEMLVPFGFLKGIVSLTKSAPIAIQHPSARKARILDASDSYDVSLDKLEDFPKVPSVPKKSTLVMNDTFVHLLTKAMATVGEEEKYPAFTKACLDINGEVNLVSSDRVCFFLHKLEVPASDVTEQLLFSPKFAGAVEDLEGVSLAWSQRQIAVIGENVTVLCTRSEGKYIDYKKFIPAYKENLRVDRNELIVAMKKACLTTDDIKVATFQLNKEEGKIHIESIDKLLGRNIHVSIPGTYTGSVSQISINAEMLLTLLGQVSVNALDLHIENETKPIKITSAENKDYTGMIIPQKA